MYTEIVYSVADVYACPHQCNQCWILFSATIFIDCSQHARLLYMEVDIWAYNSNFGGYLLLCIVYKCCNIKKHCLLWFYCLCKAKKKTAIVYSDANIIVVASMEPLCILMLTLLSWQVWISG